MPIFFILILAAVCSPIPWPQPWLSRDPSIIIQLSLLLIMLPISMAAVLSFWVVRRLNGPLGFRSDVLRVYSRWRYWLSYLNLAVGLAVVGLCGWGWLVWNRFFPVFGYPGGSEGPPPMGELATALPIFVLVGATWLIYFPAERAIRHTVGDAEEFWSLPGYLLFQFRQFALIVMTPVIFFITHQTLYRNFPELVNQQWFALAGVGVILVLFLFAPFAFRLALGLKPLPPSPTRSRLELMARRLDFRYANFLVWPTRGATTNAFVLGFLPWARYVIFTDRLLAEMPQDEVEAVLGHEIGHIHHRHIQFHALFILLSISAGSLAMNTFMNQYYDVEFGSSGWHTVLGLAVMGVYLFAVFGWLSRWSERQADVYACRAASCGRPLCIGHEPDLEKPHGGAAPCRTSVRSLIYALDRVAVPVRPAAPNSTIRNRLSGLLAKLREWQHGPAVERIEFLHRLAEQPELADQVNRTVARIRWSVILVLTAAFLLFASFTGWSNLLHPF